VNEPLTEASLSPLEAGALRGAARLIKRVEIEARAQAARVLAETEERCSRLLREAEERASDTLADAERRGFEQGLALAAAKALRLAESSARADARAESRVIDMARVLAEHLLGRSLALEPSMIGHLALAALREVRSVNALQFEWSVGPKTSRLS
jgi:flagellar biosynthesis/type III secretory pathway protein FliH